MCKGYVFTPVCQSFCSQGGGGVVSQHALQQVSRSGWYPSMPCRFPGPCQGGKLRGLARGVSKPTPKGEVEGSGLGGLQAHTRGSPNPHLGGPRPKPWRFSRPTPGGVSRPTPRVAGGVSQHALRHCCRQYASHLNAVLL